MKGQHMQLSKTVLLTAAVLVGAIALGSAYVGLKLGRRDQRDADCCQLSLSRSLFVSAKEELGLVTFYSNMGQDKWVSEVVFPGVTDGFFLDVGSGDGTVMSNTKTLEQKGWTGICIDAFPKNMQDRTCQVFKEAVSDESGRKVKFFAHPGLWGGIVDTLSDTRKKIVDTAPVVEFTTVTLRDILERAKAPRFIHFVSLDIEGGEINALKGFPFDQYRIGALTVEHNYHEPQRTIIRTLMESHGYKYVHTSVRDDFYMPADADQSVHPAISSARRAAALP
jgi:FkbM family methyltransferase